MEQNRKLLIFLAKLASYQARELMAYSLSLGSVNDPIFWVSFSLVMKLRAILRLGALHEASNIVTHHYDTGCA